MAALHYIGVHWWVIPWILVPVAFLFSLVWIEWDARNFIQRGLMPIEDITEQSLHEETKRWLSAYVTQGKKPQKLGLERASFWLNSPLSLSDFGR